MRGYSSDRFKKEEGETTKKGDKEIFTSVVFSVEGPFPHDKKNHRFKITFEDGNTGWQVRNIDKPESDFKKDNQFTIHSTIHNSSYKIKAPPGFLGFTELNDSVFFLNTTNGTSTYSYTSAVPNI